MLESEYEKFRRRHPDILADAELELKACDEMYDHIASLQAQLEKALEPRFCRWTLSAGTHQIYSMGCREEQILVAQGALGFCPNCGGRVEVV